MEKDGLIIVAVMLVSFVVLALSVGRITGLVTDDFGINAQQEPETCQEDCSPETCQEQECSKQQECNCNKNIE